MLPAPLSGLDTLAHNLWWSWDTEASALWAEIDPWRWKQNRHNPIAMLLDVDEARWSELAADAGFVERVQRVLGRLQTYLNTPGWCATGAPHVAAAGVGYLCMEFGLHESLRIYSGGLGVLAGDHLKSASDLGVPLTAVGMFWRKGYFRQVIDDGVQIAALPAAADHRLPVTRVTTATGAPLVIEVPLAHHSVNAHVWRVNVGRVRLYLLDCDVDANSDSDRALTHQLYGGDTETRIRQEMVLGVGGVRVLRALNEKAAIYHMNEGHCAFAALELARERLAAGDTWEKAISWLRKHLVFTTHTPVPAGHDRFHWEMVEKTTGPWRKSQDLPQGAYMDLGRVRPGDWHEPLCMTVLALRTAGKANGVSELHGAVSREMWHPMWADKKVDEVPITHITNGVHPLFWMAPEARAVFDEYVPGWREQTWDPEVWAVAETIPDGVLWELRNTLRANLMHVVHGRANRSIAPDALTIGFARRFAPYKRGDLLFRDPDRLVRLFEKGHVQLMYSGKAHPQDGEGKKIVAEVIKWANHPRFRDRVVFVEDYDISVGQALTSGCDVWLNNPRRPQEASGTSGQKVLLNGGMNLSILDGWWAEGFDGDNGWAIGGTAAVGDIVHQDEMDAEFLYKQLEDEVIPLWRDRDSRGIPVGWVRRMKRSIATGIPRFNTHRMVRDYTLDLYTPLVKAQGA